MRTIIIGTITLTAALFGATGCATSEQRSTWLNHGTHFASGAHGMFSLRNDVGSHLAVTRTDLSRASSESWWGDPVTVSPEQVATP